eukprot:TRINITY_DN11159_c0_g1_i3.p1 TRINITY_DN11159_c0_g1~~TRINITY_DN11159_c0_g1_i3.p1  ORF type:complete len:644 (-),score=134.74 TRINITY_DN11159_c0_g1_i3:61-1968(-)
MASLDAVTCSMNSEESSARARLETSLQAHSAALLALEALRRRMEDRNNRLQELWRSAQLVLDRIDAPETLQVSALPAPTPDALDQDLRRQVAKEEEKRKAQEDARKKAAAEEEEAKKKAALEEEGRRFAAEQEAKRLAAEEERRKAEEEEEARRRATEEDHEDAKSDNLDFDLYAKATDVELPPDICIKVTSFNVLGLGYCALPGPDLQWSYFSGLMDKLLQDRDADSDEISFVGLQEDVFVLRAGQTWQHHTDSRTHNRFERLSFLDEIFAEHGFTMVSHSVHDGLSTSSHMIIKDPQGGQLEALGAEHHRRLFTELQGDRTCTKPEHVKLGNSMWMKLGTNLTSLAAQAEAITFDTREEATSRRLVEYHMVPSRSAAKVTVQKDGVDIFAASTCHLAGGKFDDRWLLLDDSLVNINDLMLDKFGGSALAAKGAVPAVLFGDTNMKHFKYIDDGVYDAVIMGMLFGTTEKHEIKKLSPAFEGHRNFLMREGDGEKVGDHEVACLEAAGKQPADLAKVYDIEVAGHPGEIDPQAVDALFQRVKKLWRVSDLRNMQLITPSNDKASSCLFGGVIDHIFFKGVTLRDGSYRIDDGNEQAMLKPSSAHKSPFERIRATDHFPVMADFTLHLRQAWLDS